VCSCERRPLEAEEPASVYAPASKRFAPDVEVGQTPSRIFFWEKAMCRSIRVLYNFEPPTTRDEISAAARQFVRKVSGLARPSAADSEAFERAVTEVAKTTEALLASLSARTAVRTREREREKAQARWASRLERTPAR
jgi:hypothetical protein